MTDHAESKHESFRWQAMFQRSSEPIFVLDRRRRILFVNRAWQSLTGIPADQAVGHRCRQGKDVHAEPVEAVAAALAPPRPVLHGQPARVRRAVSIPGKTESFWQVDFLPLQSGEELLAILGKITLLAAPERTRPLPLPEKLTALRETMALGCQFVQSIAEVPAMQRVVEQAWLAARTRVSVLIVGEGGTGKHWLARSIHRQSSDCHRAFVALDAAALPASILSAILSGSSGVLQRPGIGTVYLGEIAGLPRELQADLHRWLAGRNDGGPRLIAGTSLAPQEAIRQGKLLEELHAALATLTITLPRLAERRPDLPLLGQALIERINLTIPHRIAGLTPEAWDIIRSFSWPGNLRELFAVLLAAAEHATGDRITVDDLPGHVRRCVELSQTPGRTAEHPMPLKELLEKVERRLIELALRKASGKKSKAARLLAIWRPLLLRRMEKLGISEGTAP